MTEQFLGDDEIASFALVFLFGFCEGKWSVRQNPSRLRAKKVNENKPDGVPSGFCYDRFFEMFHSPSREASARISWISAMDAAVLMRPRKAAAPVLPRMTSANCLRDSITAVCSPLSRAARRN